MDTHHRSIIGFVAVLLCLCALAFFGVVSVRDERNDRLLWEEVMHVRIALEEYIQTHEEGYPPDVRVSNLVERSNNDFTARYTYHALPLGCAHECGDYEITFILHSGTGSNPQGTYRATREGIIRAGN